jgi:hypothetical protein
VLAAARRAPHEAFLGLDADASRMREASRRAARPARKGGLPDVWFAVAAAEALPWELDGSVDVLTVVLPWGSLLQGVLGPEPWLLVAAARVLRPAGILRVLLSVTPRDGLAIPELDTRSVAALAERWRSARWCVLEAREATAGDVADAASSWAKRLGIPDRRGAAVLQLGRPSDP